jgi:hypothetical protein
MTKKLLWSTPTVTEVPHNSPEFWEILAALSPEDRAVVKSPEIGARLGGEGGMPEAPSKPVDQYRRPQINVGGRPQRDKEGDEALCTELVAALAATGRRDLRGRSRPLTRGESEYYLQTNFPEAPRRIIRADIKIKFSP